MTAHPKSPLPKSLYFYARIDGIVYCGQVQGIGNLDFYGDSVLAFFDPLEGTLHEAVARALRCAFEMQEGMGDLNQRNRAEGLPELQMGVGVHAGEVIVGNIGSETRAKYGIVGSAVNLTQRIQQLAEAGEVVVSEGVYVEAKDHISPTRTMEAQVKGVQELMKMYVVRSGCAHGTDHMH
jgi:class 3 adenylate cyclase